ncbi:MAG: DUF3828 domain-containing protein [Curvibacter sp.]|nr:DUF3828 domain-containing protein [Curvibacter sp.]
MMFHAVLLFACIGAADAAPVGPLETVAQLYHDFAWEAVIDAPIAGPGLLDQRDAVWMRYFSSQLVQLLRRDRQCVIRTHEICRLDFDPIWASQDPSAFRLKITSGDRPATVNVSFYPENGPRVDLKYLLVRRGAKWVIDDIQYGDRFRLRKILEAHK